MAIMALRARFGQMPNGKSVLRVGSILLMTVIAACTTPKATVAPPAPPPVVVAPPKPEVAPQIEQNKVAVLLPLTGANAAVGQSIANAANMALLDAGDKRINLRVYDTAAGGAAAAASRAVADGARLFLGPLLAADVRAVQGIASANNILNAAFMVAGALAAANPSLVHVSMTAYGEGSPAPGPNPAAITETLSGVGLVPAIQEDAEVFDADRSGIRALRRHRRLGCLRWRHRRCQV